MDSTWSIAKVSDIIEFNPYEYIPKNSLAKKVAMENIQPFTRDISKFEFASFRGGAKFRNGDTLMARITPCLENGKTAKVNILDENEIGFGSTEFIVLRAKPYISDENFVYYLALSPLLRDKAIKSMVGSSGRQRVQQPVLEDTLIHVPSLQGQIYIGNILKILDDKIALNCQINDYLAQMANAIYMQFIAGNKSYPVTLQELCDFQEGYVNPSQNQPEYFDGDVKWLRAVDINESYITDTSRTLTKTGYESAGKSALLFKPNTIAISKSGTIGRLGIISNFMCGNRAVINIIPKNGDLLPFVHQYLKSRQSEFPLLAVGSVQKNLYVSVLQSLIVNVTTTCELVDFCNQLKPFYETVRQNVLENKRLALVRDTLLPRLMRAELSKYGLRPGK